MWLTNTYTRYHIRRLGENEHEHRSVLDRFDHVFMFGDTNYRINAERTKVVDAIHRGDFKVNHYLYSVQSIIHGNNLSAQVAFAI